MTASSTQGSTWDSTGRDRRLWGDDCGTRGRGDGGGGGGHGERDGDGLSAAQAWCIYTSHGLSMWNSRIYEYAGVLFAHTTFPGTLLPASLIGISETLIMLLVSAALGQWIDNSSSRLRPLLTSIIVNRATLGLCCLLWVVIAAAPTESPALSQALFGVILALGMAEKVTRMANVLAMERGWIPTVAEEESAPGRMGGQGDGYALTHLNTVIRRIDISCKFLTPLAASGLMAALPSPAVTVPLVIGAFSILSVAAEIATLLWVWNRNGRLRAPKPHLDSSKRQPSSWRRGDLSIANFARTLLEIARAQVSGVRFYFGTSVWIPSFGIALLHASVLDWAGTLITWLLNAGFSYAEVTVAKGVGTVFEVGSTFVFPVAVAMVARRMSAEGDRTRGAYQMVPKGDGVGDDVNDEGEDGDEQDLEPESPEPHQVVPYAGSNSLAPIIQVGKWGIISLFAMLIPTVIILFTLDRAYSPSPSTTTSASPVTRAPLPTILFFTFLSLSFIGRWVYDLTVTQLTQLCIAENQRSEFGGAEMAIIAAFQLAHWVASAIWSEQGDFKWLGLVSLAAVGAATAGFEGWRRGWWDRGRVRVMGAG